MAQLRDIMTSDVLTVNETQTVQEAAVLMSEYNIGAIADKWLEL
jgi:CBS domain-containing protein